jgi:hypothetical protein
MDLRWSRRYHLAKAIRMEFRGTDLGEGLFWWVSGRRAVRARVVLGIFEYAEGIAWRRLLL